MAAALNNLAWYQTKLLRHTEAIAHCERALALEIEDREAHAAILDTLGFAYRCGGATGRAVDCHERSVNLYRDLGLHRSYAESLDRLAEVRLVLGELEPARAAWKQALVALEAVGNVDSAELRRRIHAKLTDAGLD